MARGELDMAGSSNDENLANGASNTQQSDSSLSGNGVITTPTEGDNVSAGMNSIPENYQGPTRMGTKGEVQFAGDSNA